MRTVTTFPKFYNSPHIPITAEQVEVGDLLTIKTTRPHCYQHPEIVEYQTVIVEEKHGTNIWGHFLNWIDVSKGVVDGSSGMSTSLVGSKDYDQPQSSYTIENIQGGNWKRELFYCGMLVQEGDPDDFGYKREQQLHRVFISRNMKTGTLSVSANFPLVVEITTDDGLDDI